MAVRINISDNFLKRCNSVSTENKDAIAHLMPCHIRSNGDAPVSTYFTPTIRKVDEDLKSSFRGHPIAGRVCNLPEGFSGYVVQEKLSAACDGHQRNTHVVEKFSKFYYWDTKCPPKTVPLLATMGLTKLIHSPTDSS